MPLGRLLGRFGSGAGKTVEAPLRAIVHEVLREQGFATPADVQHMRDETHGLKQRLDALEARVAAATESSPPAPTTSVPDPRLGELTAEVARLAAALAALPTQMPPPGPPLSAAPRGHCKVPGCEQTLRSKGFCSAHYQQWRRGTLGGFVGLDGLAMVDGRVLHLAASHAGGAVSVDGKRVLVDGRAVTEIASG